MQTKQPKIALFHNSGFSLVELMIVIVVIGILAAVAVPVYSASVTKAKQTEADGTLVTLYKQLVIYKAEYGKYPHQANEEYVVDAFWSDIKPGELNGMYFSDSSYTYKSTGGVTFKLTCDKGDVLDGDRVLKEDGRIDYD